MAGGKQYMQLPVGGGAISLKRVIAVSSVDRLFLSKSARPARLRIPDGAHHIRLSRTHSK